MSHKCLAGNLAVAQRRQMRRILLAVYRKEAVRLLLWAARTLGKPLPRLTPEYFLLYERFLAEPTGDWADPSRPRRGDTRRLFDGPLSERSQHQALGIVSSRLS